MNLKKVLSFIVCLILLVLIGIFLIYPNVKKTVKTKKEYYESTKYTLEEDGYRPYGSETTYRIASSAYAYELALEQENLLLSDDDYAEIDEKDYEKYDYLLIFYATNDCGENVDLESVETDDDNEELTVTLEATRTCGLCAIEYEMYEVKTPKGLSNYSIDIDWEIKGEECDSNIAYKPVLYLYPTTTTNITVDFAKEENLTTTYPKFNKNWNVTVHPNGDIYDKDNKYYYALYWEEKYSSKDFNEGFYVSKENAISFLEEKLSTLGLNPKEQNEFIMYWLPILEKNEHNLVYFELTDELQKENELIINPKPETLIRIRMHVQKVNSKQTIKEQKLTKQERVGYTAVEWGGVIYN